MSIIGIRLEQLIEWHDYHNTDQGRIQARHENDMCIGPYHTTEQQIQADTILSRQIHEEEHTQFRKQMDPLEDNTPTEHYVNSKGPQSIPEQDILAGDSMFEQKDCRIETEHSRVPYWEELKMSHTGRINPEIHLMKREYQEDQLDEFGFCLTTIIEQALKSCDGQRL